MHLRGGEVVGRLRKGKEWQGGGGGRALERGGGCDLRGEVCSVLEVPSTLGRHPFSGPARPGHNIGSGGRLDASGLHLAGEGRGCANLMRQVGVGWVGGIPDQMSWDGMGWGAAGST